MNIENPRIFATQNGSRWALIVTATEVFSQEEIRSGHEFEDAATLWEWDVSDHDHILDWRKETYRPSFQRHDIRWTANVPGDALDTELGAEEIRAQISLRDVTGNIGPISVYTPIIQISPD